MAIDFPSSPTNGQTYTDPTTGATYTYVSAYGYWQYTGASVLDITGGGTGQNTAHAAISALESYLEIVSPSTYAISSSNAKNIVITNYIGSIPIIYLPNVATISQGWSYIIFNNSNTAANVVSSGNNAFGSVLGSNTYARFICIANTGTTTSSWLMEHSGAPTRTGLGALVFNSDPSFVRAGFQAAASFVAGADSQGSSITNGQNYNYVTTTSANPSGVTLGGTAGAGAVGNRWTTIMNRGTNPVNVYPPTGGYINNQAINTPISLPVGKTIQFHQSNATHIFTSTSWLNDDASAAYGAINANSTIILSAYGAVNTNAAITQAAYAAVNSNAAIASANIAYLNTMSTYANTLSLKNNSTTLIQTGYTVTSFNAGANIAAFGTWTPNPANGNYQYANSNGAVTIAAISGNSAIDFLLTNGINAKTVTFTGYTVGTTGDPLTTTAGNQFIISFRRINNVSTYVIKALQ